MGKIMDNRLDPFNAVFNLVPSSTSDNLKQILQYKINSQFSNTPDVYQIQEEQTFGMQDWQNITVRIVHILSDKNTSDKKNDDWRGLIFQDLSHYYALGIRYYFDNNFWITVESDYYHYPTASATILRCDNILKWRDSNGVLRQEPCNINSKVQRYRNQYNQVLTSYEGYITVTCQLNQYTKTIENNQRFVFNGQAYKIINLENYHNKTYNGNDAPLLIMIMNRDPNNDAGDDLINNIANAYSNTYTIAMDQPSFNQTVGFTTTLTSTVKLNGNIVTNQPVTWSSSNPLVGTISSSGVINLLSVGSVNFTAAMSNNTSITASIAVNVASAPVVTFSNVISPNVTSLLQGSSQSYSVKHFVNNVSDSNTFTVTASGSNANNYTLSVLDGNNFTVLNKGMDSIPLVVNCMNNADATSVSITIKLKGVY